MSLLKTPERVYHTIIVGSGYGGSMTAARLAGDGRSICVLERGTTYPPGAFPRTPEAVEGSVWLPAEHRLGLFDVQELDGVDVLCASGLGGGSLIGSAVLATPPADTFQDEDGARWPFGRDELEPHLDAAEAALGGQPYPFESPPYDATTRTQAMSSAAARLGAPHELPRLAIAFGNAGATPVPGEPLSEARPNLHGRRRYTCRLVGECSIGCNYGAKNSLDYTCLSYALARGAELRPGCEVREIRPRAGGGYSVRFFDHLTGPKGARVRALAQTVHAERVVLAAGALGSTRLLLRSARHLPDLSPRLGSAFGGNGEYLTIATDCHAAARNGGPPARLVDGAHGPVTTSLIRMPDSSERRGASISDVGYSDFLAWIAPLLAGRSGAAGDDRERPPALPHVRVLRRAYAALAVDMAITPGGWPPGTLAMLTLGSQPLRGHLRATGDDVTVTWSQTADERVATIQEALASARAVANALGGELVAARADQRALCLHPLGGCPMGRSSAEGVVDPYGQVFGHPGLYVADGSIAPGPLGIAPGLTIAALADRVASAILEHRAPASSVSASKMALAGLESATSWVRSRAGRRREA